MHIALGGVDCGSYHFQSGQVIAVGLHHAFGWPGGARGVDIGGFVLPSQLCHARVEKGCCALGRRTAFGQSGERQGVGTGGLGVHRDDVPQTGYLIANMVDFGQLCGGIHKHRAGFRILQNIRGLLFEQGRVNRNRNGAGGLDGQVTLHPFGSAVRQNGDAVAGLHPQVDEPLGDVVHGVMQFPPRCVAPSAIDFDPLRGLIAARRCPCKEHVGNTLGFHRHLVCCLRV